MESRSETVHQLRQVALPKKCKVLLLRAERYHTVVATSTSLLACGENIGQLGALPSGSGMRELPHLRADHHPIRHMECSDAAIVVVDREAEVHVLHNYKCKRLPKPTFLRQIDVFGGRIAAESTSASSGSRPLVVMALLNEERRDKTSDWPERSSQCELYVLKREERRTYRWHKCWMPSLPTQYRYVRSFRLVGLSENCWQL